MPPNHTASTTPPPVPAPSLAGQYRPSEHEERVRARWDETGAFRADPSRVLRGERPAYAIVIPPPNVTDRLHLGHALNNTLQDILARAHRMMGFETLWMPGTDHAGIATQAVVERRLRKEGRLRGALRSAMGRDEFVAAVQSFKDEYEATITGQLKAMGCSCDWERQRFTMDPVCARGVHEAFFRLFRDGLIYRGKRLVNWDPALQTAVADDECEDVEIDGNFYYLRYALVDDASRPVTWAQLRARGWPSDEDRAHADTEPAWVTVATTRPETYLGDTAVAVNPRDPRAPALRGLRVRLPLVGRVVPIVEDDYVVMPSSREAAAERSHEEDPKAKYATGFLKVTPAHDPNDYEIARRHSLPMVNILAPDASISDRHGWTDAGEAARFVGLSREEARKQIVIEFKARGWCERVTPYRHSVKHSDRSKAIIEPYLSDQWYVRVTDDRLAGAALRAMAGEESRTGESRVPQEGATPIDGGPGVSPVARRHGSGAGDGSLRFHPERYARTYQHWHENIRDWCISRQLWWGHQIPVWNAAGAVSPEAIAHVRAWEQAGRVASGTGSVVCVRDPEDREVVSFLDSNGFVRDPDVLDTWFSSALWPMSTMGWPDPGRAAGEGCGDAQGSLLRAFNPTSVLCTAREIITLWVSRMVMFNRYFMPGGWGAADDEPGASPAKALATNGQGRGPVPFRDVFIHAMIQDGEGRKMSKSLGNGVDPLDIIASHGADAMRFTLALMTTHTQDVRMPVQKDAATGRNTSPKFDLGRNFCNKLWNATRFTLTMLAGSRGAGPLDQPSVMDRWMLSRLARASAACEDALATYSFSAYAQAIYDLAWRDLCDWYLEGVKPTVAGSPRQRAVLAHALEAIVRLLHPICPFITEVLWDELRKVEAEPIAGVDFGASPGATLCTTPWPRISAALVDDDAEREFEFARGLVTAIREVRATHQVAPKRRVRVHVPGELLARLSGQCPLVSALATLESLDTSGAPEGSPAFRYEGFECRASNLADAVDAGAERERLARDRAERARGVAALEARLANPGYADRAPRHLVDQTRAQLETARAELAAIEAALAGLGP